MRGAGVLQKTKHFVQHHYYLISHIGSSTILHIIIEQLFLIIEQFIVIAIYHIKLSNILYDWKLSMASFRFCETYLLTYILVGHEVRGYKISISPFLVG